MNKSIQKAIQVFENRQGILRTQQAIRLGIAPRTLYAMRDNGLILPISRGAYRLASFPPLSKPDLVQVALRIQKGVICLISALAFHNLTTQIPHQVYLALPNHAEKPRLDYPPMRLFWVSDAAYSAGIETHTLESVPVKICSIKKTIADCFRFRYKIGGDIALEALKQGLAERRCDLEQLIEFGRINRVERVMRPYLEALI